MAFKYPEVGVCGLSCRLCPRHYTKGKSRCGGCKSDYRMAIGCPFITCAVKRKGLEFCWECKENKTCEKWNNHREFSKQYDTFKCYQKLEEDIVFIQINGIEEFERLQKIREETLKEMLLDFDEGRSKSYYCIAASVLEIEDLKKVLKEAKEKSRGLEIKEKSKVLHSLIDTVARRKNHFLKLRK